MIAGMQDLPALEAVGVAHRYGRGHSWALESINLAIPAGTITALVGPNGAGKSTLIRSWMGFERPTVGLMRVRGIDPSRDPRGAIAHLGYVAQGGGLYPGLRVVDHLDMVELLRPGFDRPLAIRRLDHLRVPLDRTAGRLSGGQQAHVGLAIALATRASILLMDEPLAALDPLARHDFLHVLVTEVRERGSTALLSSHVLSDVEVACDSVVVLGDGHVLLHERIPDAIASHAVVEGVAEDPMAVAAYRRPGGDLVTLLRTTDPRTRRPTLEELVMGYLASVTPHMTTSS